MDFFAEILKKVAVEQQEKAQKKIDALKGKSYNRLHIIQIILKITLGEFVSIEPIQDVYLEQPQILESIQQYFYKCISSISLNEEEVDQLNKYVESLNYKGNYIDKMLKDAEDFDFDGNQLGDIFKYCLEKFKSDLYKENI